ncbi:hypothetical protein NL493_28800, partial [Klebsiella pneumoniae]|nr:hypothetical protein [Klebsiella pneumoniae]
CVVFSSSSGVTIKASTHLFLPCISPPEFYTLSNNHITIALAMAKGIGKLYFECSDVVSVLIVDNCVG